MTISLDEQIAYMRAQVCLEPSAYRKAALLSLRRLKRIEELMQWRRDDLVDRCREILAWQSTGELSGNALRDFAKTMPTKNHALQLAQSATGDEAMKLLLALDVLLKQVEEEVK